MEEVTYRYGISFWQGKKGVYVSVPDKTYNLSEDRFDYIADIVTTKTDGNGNGLCLIKIYTKGKLSPIVYGNWTITHTIEMPFNLQGYKIKFNPIDRHGKKRYPDELKFDELTFCGKKGFDKEIEGIFNKLIEFDRNYLDWQHYQILNNIEYYFKNVGNHPDIQLYEYCQNLKRFIASIKEISPLLNQEQNEKFIIQINKYIDYLNSIKIKYLNSI